MAPLSLPSDAFRLGDLVVVPSLNRIVRDGRERDIEPRVMRVLATLAATPGEVVTRDALYDAVWAGTVVGDEALTRAVSELRKALDGGAPGAVETIRGTGYRLALPIRPLAPEAEASPTVSPEAKKPRGGALVVLALALAALSLAVAVWAAWPRVAPEAAGEAQVAPEDRVPLETRTAPESRPLPLDSTSEYYQPGLSDLGVYYDSTEGRYFEFVED